MRQLLSGVVLVTALPLLVLDLVLYQQLASAERRSVRERLMDNAHILSALVDNEIDTHVAVAATLATAPELTTGDLKGFATEARRVMAFLPGASFTLENSTGQSIAAASPGDPANAGLLRAEPEIVAKAFSTGKPQVSDVVMAAGDRPMLFVIFPVTKAAAPSYALVLTINLERFRALIHRDFGQNEVVTILDRHFNVVAERPDRGHAAGAPLTSSSQPRVPHTPEGMTEMLDSNGSRYIMAYAPTRDGWTVGVSIPVSEVDAPVRRIVWGVSIGGVTLALLSLGFGRMMARRLSTSMSQLVNQARAVGHGQTIAARSFMSHEATAISYAIANASRELASSRVALRESESRFRGTFENAAVGVAHVGLDGRWLEINQRLCDMVGYSRDELRARTFQDITHPDDLASSVEIMRSLLAGEMDSYSQDKRYIRKDGSTVWVGLTVALERDAAGAPRYFISIIRDIARRRLAEEHQQFLLNELAHRSKNQLAIILAMARITSRNAATLEAFGEQFAQRIQGLVISSELLVAQHQSGISLVDLVRRQLQAFVPAPVRLRCEGPDIVLTADAAEAIGLALHELATNSLKHGAWSSPAGVVTMSWHVDEAGGLRLSWVERGGPVVAAPTRKGFGHEVIDRMVSQKLEGTVELSFAPEGVSWTLSIPPRHLKQGPDVGV